MPYTPLLRCVVYQLPYVPGASDCDTYSAFETQDDFVLLKSAQILTVLLACVLSFHSSQSTGLTRRTHIGQSPRRWAPTSYYPSSTPSPNSFKVSHRINVMSRYNASSLCSPDPKCARLYGRTQALSPGTSRFTYLFLLDGCLYTGVDWLTS